MVFNKSEKQEREYLRSVIDAVRSAIDSADISVKERVKTLDEQKRYLWDNKDIDPHEIKSVRENILNIFAIGEKVIAKKQRLERMLDVPYFGRIDFREHRKGCAVQPVYIGIHTFYDYEKQASVVYDWRAPISGMYYDYELGDGSYISPAGEVKGDISLKRQYRIRGGRLEYMLESSVTVHDDILQKELSATADDKMRNIVATIQREQNSIIRNGDARVLIIQGVAGSGKTSIALHRIAYLLYSNKDTLSSKDILIVSPNKVFADYISNVLPELGEETVPETNMEELLSGALHGKYKYQTFFEQVAELLEKPSPGFTDRIQYKSSLEFVSRLDDFILHVENTCFRPVDIKIKHITIPREYIGEQFRRFHRYPMRRRFEAMAEYIAEEMEARYYVILPASDRNFLKKEIKGMFAGNNELELYKEFFRWSGHPEMFRMRRNRTLEYSDLAPLAYLHIALDGVKPFSGVKHLLIDEMQDYSPVQYKVIRRLFPCPKTVLGDAAQSVNPYGSSDADTIRRALADGVVMKLCRSYRSTFEITSLAQKIRTDEHLEPVVRHGEQPRIWEYGDRGAEVAGIAESVRAFKRSGYKSLGIVCKTETQAEELAAGLKALEDGVSFLSSLNSAFTAGIVVTSAHMAKGLEFDEVIVPHAHAGNYQSEIDRGMLYVAVTRAMHKLSLTYSGKLTSLLEQP